MISERTQTGTHSQTHTQIGRQTHTQIHRHTDMTDFTGADPACEEGGLQVVTNDSAYAMEGSD